MNMIQKLEHDGIAQGKVRRARLETAYQLLEATTDQRDELREILKDLVDMESEKWAIGGGPNWKAREEAIWKRARELFEP